MTNSPIIQPKRGLQMGDCVFFQKAKLGTQRGALEVQFKGHGFGMMLGIIPHFGKQPQALDLFVIMGKVGFVTFDDVGEFLGPELATKVLEGFHKKYGLAQPTEEDKKKAAEIAEGALQTASELSAVEPSKIVDAHGNHFPVKPSEEGPQQ